MILLTPGEAHFITDPRYAAETAATITCKTHVAKGPLILAAAALIKRKSFKKIGFEPAWMNMAEHGRLQAAVRSRTSLHPVGTFLEDLRAIKSDAEIALLPLLRSVTYCW